MKNHHISIFFSEEDGGYVADVPDLVACSAFGVSPEEGLRDVQIAKAARIDALRETGKPIPRPRTKPAIDRFAS